MLLGMWRPSTPDDEPTLIDLWIALNTEDPAEDPPPRAFMQRTLKALREQPARGRFVVLELDGRVRGYALLAAFWSNEQGGETCVIDELYVVPEVRGQGHAQRLIHGLTRFGTLWDAVPENVLLEVSPSNKRACALYERLGFRPVRNTFMRRLRDP